MIGIQNTFIDIRTSGLFYLYNIIIYFFYNICNRLKSPSDALLFQRIVRYIPYFGYIFYGINLCVKNIECNIYIFNLYIYYNVSSNFYVFYYFWRSYTWTICKIGLLICAEQHYVVIPFLLDYSFNILVFQRNCNFI